MFVRKLIAAPAALALAIAPTWSAAAAPATAPTANPAAALSLAPATRAGPHAGKSKLAGGALLIGLLIAGGIVGIVVGAAVNDNNASN